MGLGHLWAGRAFGTNIGNLFVKLEGDDRALTGTLHFNEQGVGLVVYAVGGAFDGRRLTLSGKPQTKIEGLTFGDLKTDAALNPKGNLEGQWETEIGSAGTFVLFPHDASQPAASGSEATPDQLHTARHHFGAIGIDRQQLTTLAETIQRDFRSAQVVVTVVAGTEQSRFLNDFKSLNLSTEQATAVKLFVQEPDRGNVNKVVSVELGPQVNTVMTQGADEAWVLGELELLKQTLRNLEHTYTTNFKRLGFGINQLLFVGAIIFIPSLGNLRDRAVLMIGVLVLVYIVNWLHGRFLPFAAIYLGKRPPSFVARATPTVVSWLISATAGIVATLLAAYLQGMLSGWIPK
ncbi:MULTISPECIES: hypothetical protein [unclassified Bradyrhizobium]|uniref:hypothetical protein n=1 Tax=unclassified Bradyrhizobium TaxID=2631580 RepID=UPI002916EAE3|nr:MULTISPECIES: hypothetical protein [unclassified Bradyrhizobium]